MDNKFIASTAMSATFLTQPTLCTTNADATFRKDINTNTKQMLFIEDKSSTKSFFFVR